LIPILIFILFRAVAERDGLNTLTAAMDVAARDLAANNFGKKDYRDWIQLFQGFRLRTSSRYYKLLPARTTSSDE